MSVATITRVFPALKFDRARARRLRLVAVDRVATDTGLRHDPRDAVGAVLRAREDQHRTAVVLFQRRDQGLLLFGFLHVAEPLLDRIDHRCHRFDGDAHGIVQQIGGQPFDRLGHRRREEQRLALSGKQRQQAPDVVDESHVEHPVGLVKYEKFDLLQRDMPLPDQVEQTPRRSCQHVDAALQAVDLRTLVHAAENDAGTQRRVLGVVAERLVDLQRQFARGREDQRPDRTSAADGRPTQQVRQNRQREGRRLARTRLGRTEDIPAFQSGGDRLHLNGRGSFVFLVPQCAQQRIRQIQFLKIHVFIRESDVR